MASAPALPRRKLGWETRPANAEARMNRVLRYDAGISDVHHDPPRRLDVTVEAADPLQVLEVLDDLWRRMHGSEPPGALRGISWGY